MHDVDKVVVYPWRSLAYLTWWERVCLYFIFTKISCDLYTGQCITYKFFNNRVYILSHFTPTKQQLNHRRSKYGHNKPNPTTATTKIEPGHEVGFRVSSGKPTHTNL